MSRAYELSKTRFISGLQCHRQLWWCAHEPEAPELVPDPLLQALLDQGSSVGRVARAHVPGGTLIDLPWDDVAGRLAATREALATGTPAIYEALFREDGISVAVDILAREPAGWRVVEVKSSTRVEEEHVPDVALQVHVLRRAGLTVTGADVMVLNRDCVHPELCNLFRRESVDDRVAAVLADVPGLAGAQIAMLTGPLPEVPIGPHCHRPHECPFLGRCWPETPEHHVGTLYKMKGSSAEFEARGWVTLFDLPDDLPLNAPADRQRRAVKAGRMLVEGDLSRSLAPFRGPLAYLDFETVQPAIPVWAGCRPFDQIPVQFSCHRETPDGGLAHAAWIADGPGDPRPEIARRVIEACRGARAVVAYFMSFEKGRLEELAQALPALAADLRDIGDRLVDPLPVVRGHVYHPAFGGSFGLKRVIPALVPDLSYDGLAIADGGTASLVLARRVLGDEPIPAAERAAQQEALLAYCERDTLGLVRLVARLRELAEIAPAGGASSSSSSDG